MLGTQGIVRHFTVPCCSCRPSQYSGRFSACFCWSQICIRVHVHILIGFWFLQIAEGVSYVKTLQGSSITLDFKNPGTTEEMLMVNSATVVAIDVGTNNGTNVCGHYCDEIMVIRLSQLWSLL